MKIVIFTVSALILGCSKEPGVTSQCVEKGIKYYKEIGSYPNLSDGRSAEVAAQDKCLNYSGSFDSVK